MGLREALRQELIDASTTAGSRIRYVVADRTETKPYIVLQQISGTHGHHGTAADGLLDVRMQVTCVAASVSAAETLRLAVRNRLDGMTRHTLGSGSNTQAVVYIHCDNEYDDYEEPTDATRVPTFSCVLDLMIGHAETVPTFA